MPYRALVLGALLFAATPSARADGAADRETFELEQVFPRLAGKNQVAWYKFDWKHTRFSPSPTGAAVHLFFYEQERNVAQIAKSLISDAYVDLTRLFKYQPEETIPFFLYNSHFEFESTNVFYVGENVLGVTSTEDLSMAVPYWGEHRRFIEVTRHESAHQFTIQKVLSVARKKDADCNPLHYFPLWYIEGIAQHYALLELTPDVRALMVHWYHEKGGKDIPKFFDELPMTFERIYLLGHAQAQFLEEIYGEGTLQTILERSPELCARFAFFGGSGVDVEFPALVTRVTGVSKKTLEARWKAWALEQIGVMESPKQSLKKLKVIEGLGAGDVDSFALSPDGYTIFYRTFDRDTGVTRLFIQDLNDRGSRRQVTADQRVGLVSLHPFDRRVTAIGKDRIVYIGRTGATDVVFVRPFRRVVDKRGRVEIELGDVTEHQLDRYEHLIEAGYPAVDPKSGAVAFVGLDQSNGFLDVYWLSEPFKDGSPYARLTEDKYAEQGLAIAPDGALYTATDKTPNGRYQIARLQNGSKHLVTSFAQGDAGAPSTATDGTLIFQASDSGFTQAYRRHTDGSIAALSDVPTFLAAPVLEPDGDLLGISLVDGQRRLVRVESELLLDSAPVTSETSPALAEAWPIPDTKLGRVRDYDPYSPRNYGLLSAQAAAATGPFAVGQLIFADRFKNQIVGVSGFYSGLGDVGEYDLFYLDRSSRIAYGGSTFLTNGLQLEREPTPVAHTFLLQRIGGSVDMIYPFNQYMRLAASLAPHRLRAYRFSNPGGTFADTYRTSTFATEARVAYAFDSLRMSLFGPVQGFSFVADAAGTMTFGGPDPFGSLEGDALYFYPFVKGFERWVGSARVSAGTSVGGAFREQYYLPAAYNLRTVSETSLQLFGEHYYLTQLQTSFPLSPLIAEAFYLQGVVGADAGAVVFDVNEAWNRRRAAGVLGTDLGIGPILLRLHFSRPFNIGGHPPKNVWHSYLSLALAPLAGGF